MAIEPVTPSIGRASAIGKKPSAVTAPSESGGENFADALAGLLSSVDESAGQANSAVTNMLTGKGDVHEAMIALQRAETTLQLTVQVRNKLMQAYQDVMRMPI